MARLQCDAPGADPIITHYVPSIRQAILIRPRSGAWWADALAPPFNLSSTINYHTAHFRMNTAAWDFPRCLAIASGSPQPRHSPLARGNTKWAQLSSVTDKWTLLPLVPCGGGRPRGLRTAKTTKTWRIPRRVAVSGICVAIAEARCWPLAAIMYFCVPRQLPGSHK